MEFPSPSHGPPADEVAALRTELARIRAASVVSGASVETARIDAALAFGFQTIVLDGLVWPLLTLLDR